MANRVWILGAGFSQPLGGPLLQDLFRPETHTSCKSTFSTEYGNLADYLFALQIGFHWGREQAGYWGDAEEFLGFIDDACIGGDSTKREKLREVFVDGHRPHYWDTTAVLNANDHLHDIDFFLSKLHTISRRALAAQCESFLFRRDPNGEESWSPFHRWMVNLEPGEDSIITFNYDRVLEELDPEGTKLQVLKPDESEEPGKRVQVYRLHGGVDWVLEADKIVHKNARELLKSQDIQIAIAVPGRGKAHFVAKHFEDLWKRAEAHISQAQVVFIVGYGFPKSDSMALRRILDALKLKTGAPPHRDIHLVLGAQTTAATRRVAALLQTCTAGRCLEVVPPEAPFDSHRNSIGRPLQLLRIKQHPLWTQDFLIDWQDRAKPIPLA